MSIDNKYYTQAEQQYNPSYNQKVTALQNQLAQNQQNLEQQKVGVNANYDYQVQNQNLNNRLNKNNVSNAMLGRGLSNSSIAVSGLAEQDAKNTRLVGDINRNRTAELNNIDQQKALLSQNYNNTLAQMEADKYDAIMALAQQLEDRDWNRDFQNRQLAQQYALAEMQKQYQYAQLAQAQAQFEANQTWKQKEWEYQQQLAQAQQTDAFKNKIDNIVVDPSISSSDKYNALTQLYYNQNGNESNQQYLMDSYLRLMNANNNFARSTTPQQTSSQNLYGGTSQAESRKKIGYEYDPAYDFITNRR
jgi:hypothetical protein